MLHKIPQHFFTPKHWALRGIAVVARHAVLGTRPRLVPRRPVVFTDQLRGFHGFSMGFNGFLMVFNGFLMVFNGFSLVFNGFLVGFNGFLMEWNGIIIHLMWYFIVI